MPHAEDAVREWHWLNGSGSVVLLGSSDLRTFLVPRVPALEAVFASFSNGSTPQTATPLANPGKVRRFGGFQGAPMWCNVVHMLGTCQ